MTIIQTRAKFQTITEPLHEFTYEDILYWSARFNCTIREFLIAEDNVGSNPGSIFEFLQNNSL